MGPSRGHTRTSDPTCAGCRLLLSTTGSDCSPSHTRTSCKHHARTGLRGAADAKLSDRRGGMSRLDVDGDLAVARGDGVADDDDGAGVETDEVEPRRMGGSGGV